MKRVRIVALLLCVVLVVGLFTACGKKQETVKGGNEAGSPTSGALAGENANENVKPGNTAPGTQVSGKEENPQSGKTEPVVGLELSGKPYQADYVANGLPAGFATLSLTAEKSEAKGMVAADSSFIVTTDEPVSEDELAENLHLMAVSYGQELDYTVEKLADGYKIVPQEALMTDSLYRFVVGETENPYASFVFQTKSELVVKSVYPADRAVGVPTNTGVELVLSEAVASGFIGKAQDYITIEPKTEGDFRLYPDGKTIVFVPRTGFAENTVYTITVKAGLPGISGNETKDTLISQFRTGLETSRHEKSIDLQLQQKDLTVATGEAAELSFYCWYGREQKLSFNDAKLSIYAYRSASDCIEAMKMYQSEKAEYLYTEEPYRYPTEGLTKLSETTVMVKEPEEYSWRTELALPVLDAGCYLVEVELSGSVSGKEFAKKEQAMLQVTDLLLYTENSNDTMLYWVNDIKSGVVEGAELQITGFTYSDMWNVGKSGTKDGFFAPERIVTNADGVALQNLKDRDASAAFVLVQAGVKEAYACVRINEPSEGNPYYSYLYTDREKYFQNDTIRFFGILAPKAAGTPMPETIWLKASNAINPVPVKVDASGYFEGSVSLDDGARWYLNLNFSDENGNYIFSKGVSITDEQKPVYVADVAFDRLYYRTGDTVTADIHVSFYDGTPASGLTFDARFYGEGNGYNEVLVTDENGNAALSWTPEWIGWNSTAPGRIWFEASLIGDDLSNLWVSENAHYFHTDKIFDVERVVPEDGSDSYTRVQLFARDYSRLNTKTDLQYPAFPKNSYGEKLDGTVVVELYKNEYKKELISTEYDPVTKESYPIYHYYDVNECISKETKKIVNGELILPHVKAEKDFEGYYNYIISYTDPETRYTYTQETSAICGNRGYYGYEEAPYYDLDLTEGPYDIGQQLQCELVYDNKVVKNIPVLYTLYTESGMEYFLAKDGAYSFTFVQEMAPASDIYATFCDKNGIMLLSCYRLEYDFENNNHVEVSVATDKQVYRPGETVEVTLRIEDEEAVGKDAFVALSIVDEACFDLQEQDVYLNEYLSWSYIRVSRDNRFSAFGDNYRLYASNDAVTKEESAEMEAPMEDMVTNGALGGAMNSTGAEITIRKDFRDNPVFIQVPLDGKQEVKYRFTVPDNITEWRLTAIACDPCTDGGAASVTDVKLGFTVSDVVTSLPFFVSAECNELFLAGDEIIVSARSYGTGVKSGEAVSYEAKLYDENGAEISAIGVDAFVGETAWLNFGKWDCGSYTVEVTAVVNGIGDGVRLNLQVTESGTILPVEKDVALDEVKKLQPSLYPVVLSFYDEAYQPYVKAVNRLMRTYTNRNDSKVAYYIALAASEKLFGENGFYTQEKKEVRDGIAANYGLLPRLEYGEGDLYFSALVCALAPELLTESKKAELIQEFEFVLGAETVADELTLTTALFGLAALGQPVYSDLNYVAAIAGDFPTEAKWMLAAAYAYLGDFATAAELYDGLTDGVKTSRDNELYIKGNTTEETIKYTAYALLTASLVRKRDAEGLYNYLSTHTSTLDLYQLEQAAYLKYFYPLDAKPAKFSWTVGEKTQTVTLKPGQTYTLSLSKSDWNALALVEEEGDIRVRAQYLGSVAEALEGTTGSERVQISKEMSWYNKEKNIYAVTLNYTVTTDKNYSSFAISDYIPSGARWYPANNSNSSYEKSGSWSQSAYVDVLTGQSVRGSIYVYHNNSNKLAGLEEVTLSGSVTYYIRGVVEGEFAVDYAVLRDRGNGGYAISESGTVNMNDSEWKIVLEK